MSDATKLTAAADGLCHHPPLAKGGCLESDMVAVALFCCRDKGTIKHGVECSGRFRGANFPRREGAGGPFRPDFRAVIETDDGATIMFEWHGYGRAYPQGRRQIVGSVFHLADRDPYRRLNDVVCVCVGEVRTPVDPAQPEPDLVVDVAELIWEPIAD